MEKLYNYANQLQMFYYDLFKLGLENLLRSRVRTVLTILGVVIGIGALTSMISFGTAG